VLSPQQYATPDENTAQVLLTPADTWTAAAHVPTSQTWYGEHVSVFSNAVRSALHACASFPTHCFSPAAHAGGAHTPAEQSAALAHASPLVE